jgi:hypothetical protein
MATIVVEAGNIRTMEHPPPETTLLGKTEMAGISYDNCLIC